MLDSSAGQAQTEQIVTPSPRSWARVSRLLNETKDTRARAIGVNGLIGESVAIDFFHTLEEIGQLPLIDKLLKLPAKEAAKKVPATIPALYGLTYSLVSYVKELSDYKRAMELLDAVSAVSDVLPRREIQSLGMELLLGRAQKEQLLRSLTTTKTYLRVYREKAKELVH